MWAQAQQEGTSTSKTITKTDPHAYENEAVPAELKLLRSVHMGALTTANHAEFLAAFKDACNMADSDWVLTASEGPSPMDPRMHTKIIASIRGMILKSVPKAIRIYVTVIFLSQQPARILEVIVHIFLDNSEAVH